MTSDATIKNDAVTLQELKEGIDAMYQTYREQEGLPDVPVIRLGFLTATFDVIKDEIVSKDAHPTLTIWIGSEARKCMALINDEFDLKLMLG